MKLSIGHSTTDRDTSYGASSILCTNGILKIHLSYEDQDALFAYTKRNVIPTITQMNLNKV